MTEPSRRAQNRVAKTKRVLDAALKVFSQNGFSAATMDAIAHEAGITKPTLYQYFGSKEHLFKAMMLAPRDTMLLAFNASDSDCHVRQLWDFSWAYAKVVMHPDFLALARLVIGDAQRSPGLGRAYQASGPDRVLERLSAFMAQQSDAGRLSLTDPELAAEDFWGLILSSPRNTALHIPDALPNQAELARYIHNGVRVFLRAYSTDVDRDLSRLSHLISCSR